MFSLPLRQLPAPEDSNLPHLEESYTRWNTSEEHQLIDLHDTQKMIFNEISPIMRRTAKALSMRYDLIQQRDALDDISWTSALDDVIITGRSNKLSCSDIALRMKLDKAAVQARWRHLRATKQVPNDVVDALRHRPKPPFSAAEDEAIMKAWVNGVNDDEIQEVLGLQGRRVKAVAARRRQLVQERWPVYERAVEWMTRKGKVNEGVEDVYI